jgi:hypothetical protein
MKMLGKKTTFAAVIVGFLCMAIFAVIQAPGLADSIMEKVEINDELNRSEEKTIKVNEAVNKTPSYKESVVVEIPLLVLHEPNYETLQDEIRPEELTYEEHEGLHDHPMCLDLDSKGNIYISDESPNKVVVYDKNGKFLKAIKIKKGDKEEELGGADEFAVDSEGIYFMHGPRIIKKFDFNGKFIRKIVPDGLKGEDDLDTLIGNLRVTPADHLTFTFNNNYAPLITQVYDSEGRLLKKEAPTYFESTDGKAVKILPSATYSAQIQIFDAKSGEMLDGLNVDYEMDSARDYLGLDKKGRIYVMKFTGYDSDGTLYRIDLENKSREILLNIPGTDHSIQSKFKVSPDGDLYVLKLKDHILSVVRYSPAF